MTQPTVTVLTAAYNRAALLPRLFDSLVAQTYRDFEWLVVDDGSTDHTRELVGQLADRATFPVRYTHQANRGKHVALNAGVAAAAGRYCAVIDSDDWYAPEALAVLAGEWDALETPASFAEVQALCATAAGEVIGTRFPGADRLDSDAFELFYRYGVRGDKVGMQRADVLREFPFPEDLGAMVSESLVWYRIARRYQTRYLNRVLGYKEYLAGGLTEAGAREVIARAPMYHVFFGEVAQMPRPMPAKERLRAYANWIRNGRLAAVPLREDLRQAPSRTRFLLALPVGWALAVGDRRAARRVAPSTPTQA